MSTLTVGAGQAYTTVAAAVAASSSGDTINVQAGTYTNDFVTINHNLTLNAVGGTVTMVATQQPPNGKAIIDEGGSGVSVAINGFDISGVTAPDGNGAAIRYEGGSLSLTGVNLHDNQEGLLAASDPAGSISITRSTVANNGVGDGYTHNVYVGDIGSLTVDNSSVTGAKVGHEIKSRAENTTVSNSFIGDGAGGNASYEIDLPSGGNAVIQGNAIQKGANAQNPIAISFGEEGNVYANSSLSVSGNTLLNDASSISTAAVRNATSITVSVSDNATFGWATLTAGLASAVNNTLLTAQPNLASLTASVLGTPSSTAVTATSDTAATSGTTSTVNTPASTDPVTPASTDPVIPTSTDPVTPPSADPVMSTATDPTGFGFGAGPAATPTMPAPTIDHHWSPSLSTWLHHADLWAGHWAAHSNLPTS